MERIEGGHEAFLVTTAHELSEHYQKTEPHDWDPFASDEELNLKWSLEKETTEILDQEFGINIFPNVPWWDTIRGITKDSTKHPEYPQHSDDNVFVRLKSPTETKAEVAARLREYREEVAIADKMLTNREDGEIDRAYWFNKNQRGCDYYVRWLDLCGSDDSAYDYRNSHVIGVLDELISLLEA